MSYDSTREAYDLRKTSNGVSTILLNNLKFSNHLKLQMEVMGGNNSNTQPRLGLFNGNTGITSRVIWNSNDNYFGISQQGKSDDGTNIQLDSSISLALDTWYTVELEFDNGTVTAKLMQGDTVISSLSGTETTLSSNNNDFALLVGFNTSSRMYVKNIQIQEL